MKPKFLSIFPIVFLQIACSSDYSPKPRGYFYIDFPQPIYRYLTVYPFFEFEVSNGTTVEKLINGGEKEIKFNLNYPNRNARIYCSYFRTTKDKLPALIEESRKLAYIQTKKTKGVTESEFTHPEQNVYGLVYEIHGEAASPIQFVISDNTHSFFRGALYFETPSNRDSIAPVLAYIHQDIHVILESFRWKQ